MTKLPSLTQQSSIDRPISTPEYYHACIGQSAYTLESAREVIFILEGSGVLPENCWEQALQKTIAANPGLSLRMHSRGRKTRMKSDGNPARLRIIKNCLWDGRTETGSEFIRQEKLSLENGPGSELIIAECGNQSRIIFRALHAVMDGRGIMHVLHELFRALRNEPLLGTNAGFSDTDLMLSIGTQQSTSKHIKTSALTGHFLGDEIGDTWRRLSLQGTQKNLLARIAEAIAVFHQQHSSLPTLIAVPVDLRRHIQGLHSTCNYSNMLLVDLQKQESATEFKAKLQGMLLKKMEAFYVPLADLVKIIPLPWFDLLVSRTRRNYRKKQPLETAVISNLGQFDAAALSCEGFQAEALFGIPLPGNAYLFLFCVDKQIEITIGMPRIMASEGRLDAFINHLTQSLLRQ